MELISCSQMSFSSSAKDLNKAQMPKFNLWGRGNDLSARNGQRQSLSSRNPSETLACCGSAAQDQAWKCAAGNSAT